MKTEWVLRIQKLPIELAVGIYAHEQAPQPLLVDVELRGMAGAAPASLDDCLDYEPLCLWLRHSWPRSQHVPLLENRINQLLAYLFALDPRASWARVGLYKVHMAHGAQAVGMERSATREDFAPLQARYAATLSPEEPPVPCLN